VENNSNRAGTFIRQARGPDGYSAFVPKGLPPDPPIQMDNSLLQLHEAAARALGRLESVSAKLNPDNLLYMYVRKEAVLSSQIEGTQSTLSELLSFENAEAPGTPETDVREVSRYVDALLFGIEEMRDGELPLSLRLIREMHRRLLAGGRGYNQTPGAFRRTQNWIGGTRPSNAKYVPPPPHEVMPALSNLELFIQDEIGRTSPLIKAGLAHAQFESIHPFLDGNGRIGRLLISLMLLSDRVLTKPYIYISLYFKENQEEYYRLLQRVRTEGEWEEWLKFFLMGLEAVSLQASQTAEALSILFENDLVRLNQLGRARISTIQVFEYLKDNIVISATNAAKSLPISFPTVQRAIHRLVELEIVSELSGKSRSRIFAYKRQLHILDRGIGESPVA